ncbi:Kiwa anti-phage protein KwaB-like domain-containing protein [[Flexibacter] sp. ATCC 35208]|uniref:Kiwa anti-phage protein KwaB-like domain-containing protein n=1 Tax=[Flexibacter] sp. ATCC 35208 TaxID=1936242 RepID=UPI0015C32E4E|nr:Kiwa anti-phage protein KwaB-like domain-containing protein [[Flexibacter] sp. ATCC 35208]
MSVTQKNNDFYALLENGEVKKVGLDPAATDSFGNIFITNGEALMAMDKISFDGNSLLDVDEVYVIKPFALPKELDAAVANPLGLELLDLKHDKIKSIFWYDSNNKRYYFQNFDRRKLLINKHLLFFSNGLFRELKDDVLMVDNTVNAIYEGGQFFFHSYANANKIFSLIEFYHEATDGDMKNFSANSYVLMDENWLLDNANSIIRKHITLILKSGVLDNANTKKIQRTAKKFKLKIELDKNSKIIFPQNQKECRDILSYLNEQYYIGLITGKQYRTNSKRPV